MQYELKINMRKSLFILLRYFPADAPKYSIIVSMNKIGFPASGGLMAGSVFREIVDCLNSKLTIKIK